MLEELKAVFRAIRGECPQFGLLVRVRGKVKKVVCAVP